MGILDWFFGPPVEMRSATAAPLSESFLPPVGGYSDPDANLTAAQGGSAFYRGLTRNPDRDLPSITQERALQIAYWLFESNPLAKTALELTKDFVIGEGITVVATAAEDGDRAAMQAAADRFWHDPVNNLPLKLHNKVLELGLFGEACYTLFVNPKDGHVRLGYIDPALIKDVITDRDNAEIAAAVLVAGGMGQEDRRYRVAHVDERPGSPTYGRMVGVAAGSDGAVLDTWQEMDASGKPVGAPKPYAGACFYFAVNKVTTAKRGRSDLMVNFDWLDVYDQILMGEADRADLLKLFVFDVTLTGMNQGDINAYAKGKGKPKPGTTNYHNENEVWQAVTPDLKAADTASLADLLLSYIAAGARLPKTWLSGTMDVNRASASALEEPVFKRLAARQRYVKAALTDLVTFALDQAEIAGRLPKRKRQQGSLTPEPWAFNVVMPEMRSKDMAAAASAVNQITQALATALADKVIDVQVAQEVMAALLGQIGVEVDLEGLRERLEKAAAAAAQRDALAPYGDGPLPDGDVDGEDMDGRETVAAAERLAGLR